MEQQYEDFSEIESFLDSVIIEKSGIRHYEKFYPPYKKEDLHRMFSVTKSYCSLAILALIAEGKLKLTDCIANYFRDLSPMVPSHLLTSMTIENMLKMQTCHDHTTFSEKESKRWLSTFFTTEPSHKAGCIFQYETSNAHTMAALVNRLTGMGVLDYLRCIFLQEIGFSQEAYIIKDSFGDELGGSGLMAKTDDLVKTMNFLSSIVSGKFEERYSQVIINQYNESFWKKYCKLICDATSYQVPTLHFGQTIDEQQGYGYQFWMLRDGGCAMYGVGGQYAIMYPKLDLTIAITANAQLYKGGNQKILDCVINYIEHLYPDCKQTVKQNKLTSLQEIPEDWRGIYEVTQQMSYRNIIVRQHEILLTNHHDLPELTVPVYGEGRESILENRNCRIYTTNYILKNGDLCFHIRVCDWLVGSIIMLIHPSQDNMIHMYLRSTDSNIIECTGIMDAVKYRGVGCSKE